VCPSRSPGSPGSPATPEPPGTSGRSAPTPPVRRGVAVTDVHTAARAAARAMAGALVLAVLPGCMKVRGDDADGGGHARRDGSSLVGTGAEVPDGGHGSGIRRHGEHGHGRGEHGRGHGEHGRGRSGAREKHDVADRDGRGPDSRAGQGSSGRGGTNSGSRGDGSGVRMPGLPDGMGTLPASRPHRPPRPRPPVPPVPVPSVPSVPKPTPSAPGTATAMPVPPTRE
jgi:hypothetical protein